MIATIKDLAALIGKTLRVYIDRPMGSTHPNHSDILYQVNYGYIKEFMAKDDEYQDAYLLGVNELVEEYDAVCIAVINRKNDIENKLVLAPKNVTFTDKEIFDNVAFQEKYFDINIISNKKSA